MADLHKQHAVLQQEKMGGVASARVVNLTPSADGRQTNVMLRVNYRNQTHEEVLTSFVWVKNSVAITLSLTIIDATAWYELQGSLIYII